MPIIKGGWRHQKHPGKFEGEGVLAELIYDLGTDEEAGDVETMGWYGILRDGAGILQSLLDAGQDVTSEEARVLRESAGVIVNEDSQGFFSVEYYDTKEQLEDAWNEILEMESEEAGEAEEY